MIPISCRLFLTGSWIQGWERTVRKLSTRAFSLVGPISVVHGATAIAPSGAQASWCRPKTPTITATVARILKGLRYRAAAIGGVRACSDKQAGEPVIWITGEKAWAP